MPTTALGLTLTYPDNGKRGWFTTFKALAEAISAHDHTGSGKGVQITTAALAANSISGAKLRLANAEYLRARNAANAADVNLLRLTAADAMEIGTGTSLIFFAPGGSNKWQMGTAEFSPSANNVQDIGNSAARIKKLWIAGKIEALLAPAYIGSGTYNVTRGIGGNTSAIPDQTVADLLYTLIHDLQDLGLLT